MDVEKVVAYFEFQYPGKKIVKLPKDNPTEIICEVEPTEENPQRSVADAVIDQSVPHLHQESTETYRILEEDVTLFIEADHIDLKTGDVFQIPPGNLHWAVGNSALVRVISEPGWKAEDHILVEKGVEK